MPGLNGPYGRCWNHVCIAAFCVSLLGYFGCDCYCWSSRACCASQLRPSIGPLLLRPPHVKAYRVHVNGKFKMAFIVLQRASASTTAGAAAAIGGVGGAGDPSSGSQGSSCLRDKGDAACGHGYGVKQSRPVVEADGGAIAWGDEQHRAPAPAPGADNWCLGSELLSRLLRSLNLRRFVGLHRRTPPSVATAALGVGQSTVPLAAGPHSDCCQGADEPGKAGLPGSRAGAAAIGPTGPAPGDPVGSTAADTGPAPAGPEPAKVAVPSLDRQSPQRPPPGPGESHGGGA